MSLPTSTSSTGKPENFSAGVSQTNYIRSWSRDQLPKQIGFSSNVSFYTYDNTQTNVSLTERFSNQLIPSSPNATIRFVINNDIFLDEVIPEAFLQNLSSFDQRQLEERFRSSTSTLPLLKVIQLPTEIRKSFEQLLIDQDNEKVLYEVADKIAEWLVDSSQEFQRVLTLYFSSMSSRAKRILVAALSDAEITINSRALFDSIGLFLESDDKRLAQAAATYLLNSGGILGKNFLKDVLATKVLPHSKLIQGIIKLLN